VLDFAKILNGKKNRDLFVFDSEVVTSVTYVFVLNIVVSKFMFSDNAKKIPQNFIEWKNKTCHVF
jgi:hypothetical protein